MLSNQEAGNLRPLCYEHHTEMRLVHTVSENGTRTTQEQPMYACQTADCIVRYTQAEGYSVDPRGGRQAEEEILPHVLCPHDGVPMYLGEVRPEAPSFRMWCCPLCKFNSINGELTASAAA